MTPMREAVVRYMTLRGLAPKTKESYLHAIEELSRFYWRPVESLSCIEVQKFLEHLISERQREWSTVNVYFSAYRLLYEKVLKQPERQFSIPRRGRSGKRPGVLSRQEVDRLIAAPRQLKHRALLAMTYGAGLRASEAVKLKPRHIARDRGLVRVDQGKGRKDRYTLLADGALQLIEEHWRANGPFDYFFFGRDKSKPMCVGSAQYVYDQACKSGNVRRVGGIHVLRHCFATHLMEMHVPIELIQRFMGHRYAKTTAGYMHVTSEHLRTIRSPLDIMVNGE